jgi:hypothetical protein
VVGIRSLGSILSPRPVGRPRDGSSSLWSPGKLRARWGQFRSNQTSKPVVRPISVTIIIGAYGASAGHLLAGQRFPAAGSTTPCRLNQS